MTAKHLGRRKDSHWQPPWRQGRNCHRSCRGQDRQSGALTVALLGMPNTGKSTLYNRLTGGNAQIANWPGLTVELLRGAVVTLQEVFRLATEPYTPPAPMPRSQDVTSDVVIDMEVEQ